MAWRTDDSGVPLAYIPGATGGTAKEKGLDVAALPKELRNSRWLLERGGKHGSDIPNFAQMNVRNPETGKIRVTVTIFGRETPVDLTIDQVASIN